MDEPSEATGRGRESQPHFFSLDSRHFMGYSRKSPNKRFTVAWMDGDDDGQVHGHRKSGLGRFLLLEGSKVLVDGRCDRPNEGRVADSGVFVLCDWGLGEGLKGTFRAFDVSGRQLIAHRIKANLDVNGLSPDGRLAAVQALQAPGSEDDRALAIFDLQAGSLIAKWQPPASVWPERIEFPGPGEIKLHYRGLGAFRYTLEGAALGETYAEGILTRGTIPETLLWVGRLLKEADGKPSPDQAKRLLVAVDRCMATDLDDRQRPQALKLRGQCFDALGDLAQALACFDAAATLNPGIGVKRRSDQIRKLLDRGKGNPSAD